jgi:hypothetical protein
MRTYEEAWDAVPRWRKVTGFLMFLFLIGSEERICRFMFQEDWPQ